MGFWERYQELCYQHHKRVFGVGSELGFSNGTVAQWKSGSIPKRETLEKVANYFNVSVDHLIKEPDDEISAFLKGEKPLTEATMEKLGITPYAQGQKVPIIGEISAGFDGTEAYEKVIGYRDCNVAFPHNYFFLKVKGDSMAPHILDGDFALIERTPDVPDGCIAAVLYNGENASLKKIKKSADSITLIPLNPIYEPLVLVGKELDTITFCGKLISLQRDYAYL